MSRIYLIIILGLALFVSIWLAARYIDNLDEELPSAQETEKRGRAQILIDNRKPASRSEERPDATEAQ